VGGAGAERRQNGVRAAPPERERRPRKTTERDKRWEDLQLCRKSIKVVFAKQPSRPLIRAGGSNKIDYACVESNDTFMHVNKNVSGDSYIVEFVHDATENLYEGGQYGCRNFHVTKTPLYMLKILKLLVFYLPMLVTLFFMNLFVYKIPMHRKWVRLKSVSYLLLMLSFASTLISCESIIKITEPILMAIKKALLGR
jgi:hypothetical protein